MCLKCLVFKFSHGPDSYRGSLGKIIHPGLSDCHHRYFIRNIIPFGIFLFLFFRILAPLHAVAQISAPGSAGSDITQYPVFPQNDPVFVFCAAKDENVGVLRVVSNLEGLKTYTWEKYNPATNAYDSYYSENKTGSESQISNLESGGYRITVTAETGQQVFRAWVFNFWRTVASRINESNCDYFSFSTTVEQATMVYYDITSGVSREITSAPEYTWREGETIISRFASPMIYDPPTRDTEYRLTVSDRFGCEVVVAVKYNSIVTKAVFTADPMNGEAPLTVTFNNNSENGDSFEWFFFKDLDEIKRLSQGSNVPVDSIMFKAFDKTPVYTYEFSGTYMVKLVSKKVSEFHTCTDTVYLENFIVADTSYVRAPNVFTPNGDGSNDNFIVKFWSMQEVKISVFNRWGRVVHVFESKNVRGFEDTWEVSAWDGRIGGRDASEGVYYYVVEGFGRDGKKRWHKGFVHLFR